MRYFDPILDTKKSQEFEDFYFKNYRITPMQAMQNAGTACAEIFLKEFKSAIPNTPKILAAIGGGHNGGDTLIALEKISANIANCNLTLAICQIDKMRNNTKTAFNALLRNFKGNNLSIISLESLDALSQTSSKFDVIFEGIAGMNFKPPMRENTSKQIDALNKISAYLKVAIDMPCGASSSAQKNVFKADVTYATGILKSPLLEKFNRNFCGRIRYANIGFFDKENAFEFAQSLETNNSKNYVVRPDALGFLKDLRASVSDKRTYGHLFIIGGSRTYSGAVLLNVKAAIRGGCGLVTAFVPETLAPQFAAIEPSAMWIGCPEDDEGSLALESFGLIRPRLPRATAIAMGSGLTSSRESLALISEVLKEAQLLPTVLDADAISKTTLAHFANRKIPSVITPHEGEILRLVGDCSDESLLETSIKHKIIIALKSSITRISDGEKILRQIRGNPTLARAGSGDILTGLTGALLANGVEPMKAVSCASLWLGLSAESTFSHLGETSVCSVDILNYLSKSL